MSIHRTRFTRLRIFYFLLIVSSVSVNAQEIHSDNGDGTYTNPVIAADFPDPDVILVGDMYYMVTTTMSIFPGVTVLKPPDLVNWEYCSNAVPRFDSSPYEQKVVIRETTLGVNFGIHQGALIKTQTGVKRVIHLRKGPLLNMT